MEAISMNTAALAQYVGVGKVTIYNWIAAGKIPDPTVVVGRRAGWSLEAASKIREWHQGKEELKQRLKEGVKMDA